MNGLTVSIAKRTALAPKLRCNLKVKQATSGFEEEDNGAAATIDI
jgi:hypothetical protein